METLPFFPAGKAVLREAQGKRACAWTLGLLLVAPASAQTLAPVTLGALLRRPILATPAAAPADLTLDTPITDRLDNLLARTRSSGREQGACVTLAPTALTVRDVPPGDENRIAVRCGGAAGFVGDMHTHPTDDVAPSQTDLANVIGAGKRFLLVMDRAGRATLVLDTAEGRRARGAKPNLWRAYNATGAASFVAASLVGGLDPAALGGFDAAADLADVVAIAGACRLLGFACYTAPSPTAQFRRLTVADARTTIQEKASIETIDDAARRASAAVAWLQGRAIDFTGEPASGLDLDALWRGVAAAPDVTRGETLLQTMRDRRLLPIQLGRARILWLDGVRLQRAGLAPVYRTINFDRPSGRAAWPMCVRTGDNVRAATASRIGTTIVADLAAGEYRIQCVPRAGQPGTPVALRQTIADGRIRTGPLGSVDAPQMIALDAMCLSGEQCLLSPATTAFTQTPDRVAR